MKRYCFLLFTIMASLIADGQTSLLDAQFNATVKSVDEFMARFNGIESKPGVANEGESRRNNILALFDYTIESRTSSLENFKNTLTEFVSTIDERNVQLQLVDVNAWSEVKTKFIYGKKSLKITLVMHLEHINNDEKRWVIAGVRGLEQAGLYDKGLSVISPVEHELHFMGLSDLFLQNKSLIASCRSSQRDIDELSMFLGLTMCGSLKFSEVSDVEFHFTNVPGFIFTIREIMREGSNCGWLITDLKRANDKEKEMFINNLFGYKSTEE